MIKRITVSLFVLLALLAGWIASLPSAFTIERSLQIAAPAEVLFGLVDDLHHWADWSPWEGLDPEQTRTYEGPRSGEGAIYAWRGNDQVGAGRMTITRSRPHEEIVILLEFLEPWQATNTTTFLFAPDGDGTEVVWRMEGENGFGGKVLSLLMDMDAMVGADFEKGLGSLAELAAAQLKEREAAEEARRRAEAEAERQTEAAVDVGALGAPDAPTDPR